MINVFQNQEIAVFFAEPVDLFSVNTSSFRVVNVANGTSPTGQFLLDPTNQQRLIWRPSLTFDQFGNPQFGLEPNTSYQITIPGEAPPGEYNWDFEAFDADGNPVKITTKEGSEKLLTAEAPVELVY